MVSCGAVGVSLAVKLEWYRINANVRALIESGRRWSDLTKGIVSDVGSAFGPNAPKDTTLFATKNDARHVTTFATCKASVMSWSDRNRVRDNRQNIEVLGNEYAEREYGNSLWNHPMVQ